MTAPAALEKAKLGAFEEGLTAGINAGALCLMASISHRTGQTERTSGGLRTLSSKACGS